MRYLLYTLLLAMLTTLTACQSLPIELFQESRQMILEGKAECVLISNNQIIAHRSGRGISPLLELYDSSRQKMQGAVLVDKVIGRAAAAIAISGGVSHVHGEIMSEDAAAFLRAHKIVSTHTRLVPKILNRKQDGLCPMEEAVEGITDPATAVEALRKKISQLSGN